MFHKSSFRHRFYHIVFTILFLYCTNAVEAQNFVFAQLTGSPVNTTGWNLQGAAKVTNVTGTGNSEILLCPAAQNQSGAVFYNQPINLSLCITWTAEFDFRIYDGSAADGLAFCFLDVPPTGFVTGGGLGIPSTANGLKICFDTYPNCQPQNFAIMPKLEIRWGAGYNECLNQPTLDNSTQALSFVRSTTYNHAKITYNNGNINVYLNNSTTPYLTGFQQFNFTGYLGFTAGTGGSTDNHSIKNVVISTNMPPSVANAGNNITTTCSNNSLQIGTTNNPAYVYSWSPATGLSNTTVANPTVTLPNINDTAAITRKYYVQTAFSNAVGCYSTDSVTITVAPSLPAVSIITSASASTICQGTQAFFTAIPTNGGLSPSYLWKVNSTKVGNNSATFSSSSLVNNDIVSCVMTSSAACLSVDTAISNPVFMTVNASVTPAINIAASTNDTCIGSPFTFTATSTNGGTAPAYQWQLNGVNVGNNTNTYTDSLFKTGDIINCVLTSNSTNCITTTTATSNKITLTVFPKTGSLVHITVSANNICPDSSITVTATPTNGGIHPSYQWQINGQNVAGSNQTYTSLSFKNGDTVSCILTSSNPCTATDTSNNIIMSVYPVPVINMGNEVVTFGGSIELNPLITGDIAYYLWTPGNTLNDSTIQSPTATPTNTTTYQLDIATKDGCKISAKTTVTTYVPFQIPTAFTPNGDGKNDVFRIPPFIPLQITYFSVFDRWGNRVFTTTDSNTAWDGTANGTPQPAGAYVWIIEYKNLLLGKFVKQSGTVMLIR